MSSLEKITGIIGAGSSAYSIKLLSDIEKKLDKLNDILKKIDELKNQQDTKEMKTVVVHHEEASVGPGQTLIGTEEYTAQEDMYIYAVQFHFTPHLDQDNYAYLSKYPTFKGLGAYTTDVPALSTGDTGFIAGWKCDTSNSGELPRRISAHIVLPFPIKVKKGEKIYLHWKFHNMSSQVTYKDGVDAIIYYTTK